MGAPEHNWIEANQHDLMAAVGEVRVALDRVGKGDALEGTDNAAAGQGTGLASAVQTLCFAFGLSRFERAILMGSSPAFVPPRNGIRHAPFPRSASRLPRCLSHIGVP